MSGGGSVASVGGKGHGLLAGAKKPVILLGRAAYAQVDDKIRKFIEATGVPFLPDVDGQGLLPDNHELSVNSMRSYFMEQADVVMLIGARLNWLLSRGHGKWNPDGKFIQIDIDPRRLT